MKWLILTSCTLVPLLSHTTLADNDVALTSVDGMRVHLAKGGGGWIEVTSTFQGVSDDPTKYDILAEYGVTSRKTHIVYAGEGRRRAVTRGDFADVLEFVKIIDSGSPFLLWRRKDFDITWNTGVLTVRLKYNYSDKTNVKQSNVMPAIEVTTDGRFSVNTSGEVNQGRTKTIITSATEIVLEVERLGLD